MKVLILGGAGMMGHKAFQVLSRRFDTSATFRSADGAWADYPIEWGDARCITGVDATVLGSVEDALDSARPDVVLNCVGVIKQLPGGKDAQTSVHINSLFPHQLADLCGAAGARLIHMSTDCVFSGSRGAYTEDDPADATDLYGRSKLLGEVDRPGCLTIRTSIFGRDFVKDVSLLEWFLANRGGSVNGFVHAVFSGFPTVTLAGIIGDVIADHPALEGLYHVSSDPIDKFVLLTRVKEAMGLDVEIVASEQMKIDRSLDCSRFRAATGYEIPSWDRMLEELAADPTPYDAWRAEHAIA